MLVQALAGSASAQQAIGHAFWVGDGVGRNKRRALSFLKMAARQGDPHHQMDYGIFLTAQNNREDFRNGFSWILRAAKNGLREAQYFVASEYASGYRINKNLKIAASWYDAAARQGSAEAKYNLALMLLIGEGVEKDVKKGRRMMIVAAKSGEIFARRLLCDAYRNGVLGFRKNRRLSQIWQRESKE